MLYRHAVARKLAALPDACPSCGERGCLRRHGYYLRGVVRWRGGAPVAERMAVARVRCRRCGKTHALLPTSVVPYSALSVEVCVRIVLAARRARSVSRRVAAAFDVSVTACRRLLADAARLAEALGCALEGLDEALAHASRDACALAARFAATHGTAPFSHVGVAVDGSCLCVVPPHT